MILTKVLEIFLFADDSSDAVSKKKKLVVEDEFNIEPLKPIEKVDELLDEKNRNGEEKKLISSEETRRKQVGLITFLRQMFMFT